MESGSHIDRLGLVWILGMFNLALELLLDNRPWWFGSFGLRVSHRFLRDSFVGLADGGEEPTYFELSVVVSTQSVFKCFDMTGVSIVSFYSPPSHLLLIICVIWHIKKAFWILGHHTETFLIALPASPAHWDCWGWWISTGGLHHDLSDSKEGLIVAHDSVLIYPLDNAMGLPNSGGSVRSRGRGAVDHGRCPCLFPKGCMNMSGQSALVEVHDALAGHRSIFLGRFLNHCMLMMSNLVWDGLLLLTRGKFKMNPEIAGLHPPNLHLWTPFHGLLGASVEETH